MVPCLAKHRQHPNRGVSAWFSHGGSIGVMLGDSARCCLQKSKMAQQYITKSYSDPTSGQDAWVAKALKGMRNGWFFDAGAGPDGVHNSNTYALEIELGWTGICVEPHPDRVGRVRANRQCHVENVCLGNEARDVEFVLNRKLPGTSGVADMLSDTIKQQFYSSDQEYETIAIPAVTLADLLRKFDAPKTIDYMSLDLEGAEWPVLEIFPFDKFKFRCVTLERCRDHTVKLRKLMVRNGYRLVHLSVRDDFWVHRSEHYLMSMCQRMRTTCLNLAQIAKYRVVGRPRKMRLNLHPDEAEV